MSDRLIAPWLLWPQTRRLIDAFAKDAEALRFVGGAVRDALLGRDVIDVDAATTLLPEETIDMLKVAGIQAIPTGLKHGTVTAVIDGKHFEITTLRTDVACDGRHADVEFTSDWEQDAKRRDFTMNALFLSPDGTLFDYVNGQTDALAGRVAFIGDAETRISEDYLRILRLFRFQAYYGKLPLDAIAVAACQKNAHHITSLSGERIAHEMLRLLSAKRSALVLAIMMNADVLKYAMDYSIDHLHVLEMLETQTPGAAALVKLAALLMDTDDAVEASGRVTARWKLSNSEAKHLRQLLLSQAALVPDTSLAQQKKLLRQVGADMFVGAVILAAARTGLPTLLAMAKLVDTWPVPQFPVRGEDLIAIGIKPSKTMGEKLKQLEAQWEASDYQLSREALLAMVQ